MQYVETFYPLWFTNSQAHPTDYNVLIGPERVSPIYHSVVMINDDTVYCSAFLNLDPGTFHGEEMVILTVPETVTPETCSPDTSVTYSILLLDPYGDVVPVSNAACSATPTALIPHGAPPQAGGTYALVGPNSTATPPPGATLVQLPWSYGTIIFRSDKYHSFNGGPYVNQIAQSYQFRSSLRMQTLSDYQHCSHGGEPSIKTEFPDFAVPYKTDADGKIAVDPVRFLQELQTAVHSVRTPDLSPCNAQLSQQFDNLFGNGNWKKNSAYGQGTQAAHTAIENNYVYGNQAGNNWTHIANIGNWNGDDINDAIDRSSITEYCQFCNDINSAGYYHAFRDSSGRDLNGNNPHGYVLTFSPAGGPNSQPATTRFWSLTAYTPQAIELIPNSANKYEVASYSGAQPNPDGSLSIYMSTEQPANVPFENWLPVQPRPFNVVLRDYGPLTPGSVVCNTYTPPAIQRLP